MTEGSDSKTRWYKIENENEVYSPAILVYPGRIEENILRMINIAGSVNRLRPHVKTHKIPEIVRLQLKYGIKKFKCATIAEAEMAAMSGASDILLAYQPVGPAIKRFLNLKQTFPDIRFSCIADSVNIIKELSDVFDSAIQETEIWLDINVGMNRTGIEPGDAAIEAIKMISKLPMLKFAGLHIYDGHINDQDPELRRKKCNKSFEPVNQLINDITRSGRRSPQIVAGGTPTFPIHAQHAGAELSPGTTLLWDYHSSSNFKDLDFLYAGMLFIRVISKPAANTICLDLGHKAVASEMPQPRVIFPEIEDASIIGHNEEHMVVKTTKADMINIGDVIYGIPWHICPTVDRYEKVTVVREEKASGQWNVEARKRVITI